jgi:hypothetical protein
LLVGREVGCIDIWQASHDKILSVMSSRQWHEIDASYAFGSQSTY